MQIKRVKNGKKQKGKEKERQRKIISIIVAGSQDCRSDFMRILVHIQMIAKLQPNMSLTSKYHSAL